MAEKRHVQHLRSKVVENGGPKLPESSSLYVGEIAINYAKGYETISMKNESGDVVTFTNDNYYSNVLDTKVNNSDLDGKIAEAISGNASVSGAVVDIVDGKLASYSSATEVESALSNKADKVHTHAISGVTGLQDALDGKSDTSHTHTHSAITDFDSAVASAITGSQDVQDAINEVVESQIEGAVSGKADTTAVTQSIDAATSGKVDTSTYETYTAATDTLIASKLSIEDFNTYSAATDTLIDAKLNTADFDDLVGSGFTSTTITEVINENELTISSALNDLNSRIIDIDDALDGKQDTLEFDGTYSSSTNKVATVSTVTNAINALDGGTIGTGGTSKTITSLTQSNGNVSATFADIEITSGAVTNFASAVTSVVSDVISSDASVSGAITSAINSNENVVASKSMSDYFSGHNPVSTLDNVPISKRLVIASISANTNNFTLSSSALTDGYDVHIIVNNTNSGDGSITVTLPTSTSPYKVVGDSIITIADGSYGEINVISDGTTLYVRGA